MTEPRPNQTISIIGLGKLGAPIAACIASKGHRVIGVDVNPRTVQMINDGVPPLVEPGLEELLANCRGTFVATHEYKQAIQDSGLTFIVVPTPSDEQGGYSLEYVLEACDGIGEALREKDDYHLVVLVSTVLPGATEGQVKPRLETLSGKRCGIDFGLCYSPEFIALGSVIRDYLNPDIILIGESDTRAGELLSSFYTSIPENEPAIIRMNIVNAELAKLAVNAYITVKITFANTLARMCERLPGANVDTVTAAVGLDSRIGSKYLKGAIGYGGPCFPRDNRALAHLAHQLGLPAQLAEVTDAVNRSQVDFLATLTKSKLPKKGTVGILGLAYKPNTDVVEESPGLLLAQSLLSEGIPTNVYDPVATPMARAELGGSVSFSASLEECIRESDVVVITTQDEKFARLPVEVVTRKSKPRVLIDCWRMLDLDEYDAVAEVISLGIYTDG